PRLSPERLVATDRERDGTAAEARAGSARRAVGGLRLGQSARGRKRDARWLLRVARALDRVPALLPRANSAGRLARAASGYTAPNTLGRQRSAAGASHVKAPVKSIRLRASAFARLAACNNARR